MPIEDDDTVATNRVRHAFHRDEEVLRRFLIRALNSREDAEDILQEVYLRLLKRERDGAIKDYPRSYLFVTATNIIRDRRRRERVKERAINDPLIRDPMRVEPVDPQQSAEAALVWREGIEIVNKALREIKPRYAEIFFLRWGEGLTISEISKRKGIPVRSVERYASHALSHCKRALEKQEW